MRPRHEDTDHHRPYNTNSYTDTNSFHGDYRYQIRASADGTNYSGPSNAFPPPRYAIIDLGTNQTPVAFNNPGSVVLQSGSYGSYQYAYWTNGVSTNIPAGFSGVSGMNDSGVVVGATTNYITLVESSSEGPYFEEYYYPGGLWTPGGSIAQLASTPANDFIYDTFPTVPGSLAAGSMTNGFGGASLTVTPAGIADNGAVYGGVDELWSAPGDSLPTYVETAFAARLDSGIQPTPGDNVSWDQKSTVAFTTTNGTYTSFSPGVSANGVVLGYQVTVADDDHYDGGEDPFDDDGTPDPVTWVAYDGATFHTLAYQPQCIASNNDIVGNDGGSTNVYLWTNYVLAATPVNGISGPINNQDQIVFGHQIWQTNQLSGLNDLVPDSSGWNYISAGSFNGAINDGGAIVGTANDTNSVTHAVMLLPVSIVRETSPGSGDFEPITDNGLDDNAEIPIFASETGQGTTETVTGPYSLTAVLSVDLSSTSTATINVTYTASGGSSYTGTLTETAAGSGVFKDSGGTNVLTLTPSSQTTSSTSPTTLSATITLPTLSVSSQPITLVPTDTLTYQASTVMTDVALAGALSTTVVNSITVSFYNASSSTQNYSNTLTETGVNTRVFQDSSGDTTLTMTGYTGGTSMNFSVSTSEFSPTSFSDTLTETGTGSLQFSNYQTTVGTAPDSTPETDGQGVFYVQFPGSTATSITLVSGSNSVTTTASPVTGQPNLLRTGKLVLLAPGDPFTASDITTLTVSPPSGGGIATVQLQMYGQTIVDPGAPNQAYLGCGMPWPTDGGTFFLTQIQGILQGTPGNPGLGWTVPNIHARLVKSDFLSQLQTHDLFFIFTHGLTPKSNPAIPYLVSFQFFNSANPDDHVQAELVPTDVSSNIGNNHPELVFFDACFSADQTTGSAANVNAPNNFVTNFQANAYVGWAHGQFDWVGILDAKAFFNALKQHNSIQNAANAALNGSIIKGIPLLVLGNPTIISKTIIDKGSQ